MADQLRWDALGVAGRSGIQTPNLDRLAKFASVLDVRAARFNVLL
jgi:arylsulfatase A-like enzyme